MSSDDGDNTGSKQNKKLSSRRQAALRSASLEILMMMMFDLKSLACR